MNNGEKKELEENWKLKKNSEKKFWKHAQIEIAQDMSQRDWFFKKRQPKKNKENKDGFAVFVVVVLLT